MCENRHTYTHDASTHNAARLRRIPLSRFIIDDSMIQVALPPNGRTNESLFLLSRLWRQFSLISALIFENYDSDGRPTHRRRRTIIGFLITTLLPFTNDFASSLTAFRFEKKIYNHHSRPYRLRITFFYLFVASFFFLTSLLSRTFYMIEFLNNLGIRSARKLLNK